MVEDLRGTGEFNSRVVKVRLNEPFTVSPRLDLVRYELHDFLRYGLGSVHDLDTIPLEIEGMKYADVSIEQEFSGSDGRHTPLFPLGEPKYSLRMEPETGLIIVESMPISVRLRVGIVTREQIEKGEIAFSIFCKGQEFLAVLLDMPAPEVPDQYDKRILTAGINWINLKDGKLGPMYFPSDVDFNEIKFLISTYPLDNQR